MTAHDSGAGILLPGFESGIYLVEITTGDNRIVNKVYIK